MVDSLKNYKDFYIYVELAKENHSTMNIVPLTNKPSVQPQGEFFYNEPN